MAKGKKSTPMKVRKHTIPPSSIPSMHTGTHAHRLTHLTLFPPFHPPPNLPTHAQRLKFLLVTGYAYARPVAYYGMIPFVLYVGMNGDAAPNWSDLPRYLLAVF
jgi:hypothetical protein